MASIEIWSGGQTGVDRAAMEIARELGITLGGWVPKGRLAEDGPIPASYAEFQEADSEDPNDRTWANVRDTQATLILRFGEAKGGTLATVHCAMELAKPFIEVDLSSLPQDQAAEQVRVWVEKQGRPLRLNVAGPRASEAPEAAESARGVLRRALS